MLKMSQAGDPACLRIKCKEGKIVKIDMCMF